MERTDAPHARAAARFAKVASNYSYPRADAHDPYDEQTSRTSLGSEESVPSMVEDLESDVSVDDDCHASEMGPDELWDTFWQQEAEDGPVKGNSLPELQYPEDDRGTDGQQSHVVKPPRPPASYSLFPKPDAPCPKPRSTTGLPPREPSLAHQAPCLLPRPLQSLSSSALDPSSRQHVQQRPGLHLPSQLGADVKIISKDVDMNTACPSRAQTSHSRTKSAFRSLTRSKGSKSSTELSSQGRTKDPSPSEKVERPKNPVSHNTSPPLPQLPFRVFRSGVESDGEYRPQYPDWRRHHQEVSYFAAQNTNLALPPAPLTPTSAVIPLGQRRSLSPTASQIIEYYQTEAQQQVDPGLTSPPLISVFDFDSDEEDEAMHARKRGDRDGSRGSFAKKWFRRHKKEPSGGAGLSRAGGMPSLPPTPTLPVPRLHKRSMSDHQRRLVPFFDDHASLVHGTTKEQRRRARAETLASEFVKFWDDEPAEAAEAETAPWEKKLPQRPRSRRQGSDVLMKVFGRRSR